MVQMILTPEFLGVQVMMNLWGCHSQRVPEVQALWSPAWCGCRCHSTLRQEVLQRRQRGRLFWRVPVKTAGMEWNLGEMSQNLQHHVFFGMKWDEFIHF